MQRSADSLCARHGMRLTEWSFHPNVFVDGQRIERVFYANPRKRVAFTADISGLAGLPIDLALPPIVLLSEWPEGVPLPEDVYVGGGGETRYLYRRIEGAVSCAAGVACER